MRTLIYPIIFFLLFIISTWVSAEDLFLPELSDLERTEPGLMEPAAPEPVGVSSSPGTSRGDSISGPASAAEPLPTPEAPGVDILFPSLEEKTLENITPEKTPVPNSVEPLSGPNSDKAENLPFFPPSSSSPPLVESPDATPKTIQSENELSLIPEPTPLGTSEERGPLTTPPTMTGPGVSGESNLLPGMTTESSPSDVRDSFRAPSSVLESAAEKTLPSNVPHGVSDVPAGSVPPVLPTLQKNDISLDPEKYVTSPQDSEKKLVSTDMRRPLPQELQKDLCVLPESVTSGLKRISLMEFLSAYSGTDVQLRTAVKLYWSSARDMSEVAYWADRVNALKQKRVSPSEEQLLDAARADAQAALDDALKTLRVTSIRLARDMGSSQELWVADLPHVGKYNTDEQALRVEYMYSPVLLKAKLVTARYEQLYASAAAYQAAASVVQSLENMSAPLVAQLQAHQKANQRRETFIEIMLAYNGDILDYILALPNMPRGEALVPYLIKNPSQPERKIEMVPSGVQPILPTETGGIPMLPGGATVVPPGESVQPTYQPGASNSAPSSQPTFSHEGIPEKRSVTVPGTNERTPVPVLQDMSAPSGFSPTGDGFQPAGGPSGSSSVVPRLDSGAFKLNQNRVPFILVSETEKPSKKSVLMNAAQGEITQEVPEKVTVHRPARTSTAQILEQLCSEVPGAQDTLSLEDVLMRARPNAREAAAIIYWRYIIVQAQQRVLKTQIKILESLNESVLRQASAPGATLAGLQIEEARRVLETERAGLDISLLNTAWELASFGCISSSMETDLPVAVTRPNGGNYQLFLERVTSNRVTHAQLLHMARHLDYCALRLKGAATNIQKILPQIHSTGHVDMLQSNIPYAQYPSFLLGMELSRKTSANYLRLAAKYNELLTICVFRSQPYPTQVSDIIKQLLSS